MNTGILPVLPSSGSEGRSPSDVPDDAKRDKKTNAGTGASAAGVRALTARVAAFYFRAPVRSFFRTRVDYLAYPRAISLLAPAASASNPGNNRWTYRQTTPFILFTTIKQNGWSFLPLTILPPLLANVSIATVLYTTYLSSLALYHPPSSSGAKRIYPPPPYPATFFAGATAGAVQTLFAAPFDALTVRFRTPDLASGRYGSMWTYASSTLRRIGFRGAYAGSTLSLVKDSLGAGLFFSTFEVVKSQAFYAFVRRYYGVENLSGEQRDEIRAAVWEGGKGVIRPHYLMEPAFLLLAGAGASVAQQVVVQPLGTVQEVHWGRCEGLDRQLRRGMGWGKLRERYMEAYRKTARQCAVLARREGGWRRWLFRDFWMSTLRQVPSTSAGLIAFEIVRRKYGFGEPAKIVMDGYDILLP
ncbi:hypothetical protein C1H76_3972 [Elsinoe australis]|uniref:Uncharacterized protein n=1 Tax=Elsinoe australis TaxID=40998 RepID=A0A4U7AYP0_9PEZI|nr:hypothetical protein C1H76_3972 [Elsinoe australis]